MCKSRQAREACALRGLVAPPRRNRRRTGGGRDPVLPELAEKCGGTSAFRQRTQRPKRILGPKREHGAKGVRVDTHPAEFVQQDLERLFVGQPRLRWRSSRSDISDHYKQTAHKSYIEDRANLTQPHK